MISIGGYKRVDQFFKSHVGGPSLCLGLFVLVLLVFGSCLSCDFQFYDDFDYLLNNSHVNSGINWSNCAWALFSLDKSNWYPVTWISHMWDFELFGAAPWGHHLTNVLFHAANSVLLFLVLRKMTGALWRSFIVAGLFAFHPLRVESVAWISERKDVLSTFWGFLALWTYVRFAEEAKMQGAKRKTFYGLTVLFFALSLMSKAMLVTFPCILLLLDFWPLERWRLKGKWSLVLEKVPFILLVVPVSFASYFAQKVSGQLSMLNLPLGLRMETALMSYARYLGKLFWPVDLSVLYPYPASWPVGQLMFAAMLILGITLLAVALRQRGPYLLVGWFWYLGTFVPVIGLIQLGVQSMSNRYTYLPMVGVFVLLVWGIEDLSKRWRQRTSVIISVVAMVMAACMMRTRAEIVYWKDSATLLSRAIAVTKNNFMAHYCLGNILCASNNPDQALAEFQEAVNINPSDAGSQRSLAMSLVIHGRYLEAVHHYEMAIRIEPENSWNYNALAACFLQLGRAGDAVAPILKAAELEPKNTIYTDHINVLLTTSGHEAEVISNYLEIVRPQPKAFSNYLDVFLLDTNRADMMNNLAWAFATNPDPKLRNGHFAVRLAKRACEITSYQITVCVGTLAAAYAEDSRFDEAVSTSQLACSLAASAGQPDLLKKNQELLDLFRSHQPYHEAMHETSGQK